MAQFKVVQSQAVAITNTSQMLSGVNASRVHFSLDHQDSTSNIYLHFGEEDATTSNGILIKPDEYYETYNPGRGEIHAISASGTNNCVVSEG